MNGALPPDLSLIVNAREGGPNYVYGILTGFVDPPAGFKMRRGNELQQDVPRPSDRACRSRCRTARSTTPTAPRPALDQEAHDVVTFLAWAANPEMVERKQIGVRVVLFLVLMTGLTYAVKRKVWSDVHH